MRVVDATKKIGGFGSHFLCPFFKGISGGYCAFYILCVCFFFTEHLLVVRTKKDLRQRFWAKKNGKQKKSMLL